MTENEIATQIVDAAYKIHTTLGPGLLESAYQKVLVYELRKRGLNVAPEYPIPLVYETVHMEIAYRADLLVNNKVIVELKAVKSIIDAHEAQLINYLKATDIEVGLLLNFGTEAKFKRKIFTKRKR